MVRAIEVLLYRRYNATVKDTFSIRLQESIMGIPHSTTRMHSEGQIELIGLGRYLVKMNARESFLDEMKKEDVRLFVYSSDIDKAGAYINYIDNRKYKDNSLSKNSSIYIGTDYEWMKLLEEGVVSK